MTRALHLVAPQEAPADMLAEIVPELLKAEQAARRLRQMMLDQGRKLAREEGVSFLREEALRRRFGGVA